MSFIKNYWKQLLLAVFLMWFTLLAFLVITTPVLEVDTIFYNTLMKFSSYSWTSFFLFSTFLWSTYMIIAVALLTTILFFIKKKYKRYTVLSFLTPAIVYLVNCTIKNIVQRPRPNILRLVQETDYSFPSWHTMESLAVYGLLIVFCLLNIKNRSLKYWIASIIVIIITCIALSRIYLWVHYFTDILWWLLLSWSYLLLINIFSKQD